MNRLLKAEWYRVRKSYGILKWIFVFLGLIAFVSWYTMEEERYGGLTLLFRHIATMGDSIPLVALLLGGCYVASYENKLLYFDMMAGNKISHIILSKCLAAAPLLVFFETLLTAGMTGCTGMVRGFEDVSLWRSRLVLFTCINFRVLMTTVLIMTVFKGVAGMGILFLRFMMLDGVAMLFFSLLMPEGGSVLGALFKTLVSKQYYLLLEEKVGGSDIAFIIGAMAVEIGIWYVISYISHKRRWFY